MCDKCNKTKCTGCSSSSSNSQLEATLAEIQDQLEVIASNTKAFSCGHPILLIENADDIASFDADGLGFDCWDKWAICDGSIHINPITKKPFTTPNFVDRFIVQANGNYAVGDTGGLDTVVLDITQIPSHSHAITDPGHTHDITDPGHDHGTTEAPHTHAGTGSSHTHTFSTNNTGFHEHTTGVIGISDDDGGDVVVRLGNNAAGASTSTEGAHSHSGTTDPSGSTLAITAASTGLGVDPAFVGITETESNTTGITTQNIGGGLLHENRPPYYAALYVIKYY